MNEELIEILKQQIEYLDNQLSEEIEYSERLEEENEMLKHQIEKWKNYIAIKENNNAC